MPLSCPEVVSLDHKHDMFEKPACLYAQSDDEKSEINLLLSVEKIIFVPCQRIFRHGQNYEKIPIFGGFW
jgi:hypothetical protein